MATWPTDPGFMSVRFRSRDFNLMSESVVGHSDAFEMPGQRFEFTGVYNNMTWETFLPVWGFTVQHQYRRDAFDIVLPNISDNQGDASGAITLNGAFAAGSLNLEVNTFTGTLPRGQMITFAGHTKVYTLRGPRSGAGTLFIFPPLYEAVADAEAITYDGVIFTCRLARDIQEFPLSLPGHTRYEVDFIEAF